jgi:predicted HAD superfamily Cof-like phosphohydrolase
MLRVDAGRYLGEHGVTRPPEQLTAEFHDSMGLPLAAAPTVPPLHDRITRARLHVEETGELVAELLAGVPDGDVEVHRLAAIFILRAFPPNRAPDLVAILRELADNQYINGGTANVYGLPLTATFEAVHAANMAKLWPDGAPRRDEYGKVLKPAGWTPPDIAAVLAAHTPERAA